MADGALTHEQRLGKATADLEEAKHIYKDAEAREDSARRDATAALNRLNDKPKNFDAAIAEIKKQAAPRSNWGSASRQRLSVTGGES